MARFLVVYGSKQGQSAKIASRIAKHLRDMGHAIEDWDAEGVPDPIQFDQYDAFIIGGGVHASGYPHALVKWTKKNAHHLVTKPSAFFSVCLGILQKDPRVQEDEQKIMQTFFKKTGWYPKVSVIFDGALAYSKYNWFLKRIMRAIARKAGGGTNLKHDYEYTNWNDVQNFTLQFAATLKSAGQNH